MSSFQLSITAEQAARRDFASRLSAAGAFVLRYSLVFFLVLFGAAKWTAAEAKGIEAMVSHSPFLFWLYPVFGIQGGSEVIGVVELDRVVDRRAALGAARVGDRKHGGHRNVSGDAELHRHNTEHRRGRDLSAQRPHVARRRAVDRR